MRNGHSTNPTPIMQVLLIEPQAGRRERVAKMLARHGLSVRAVPSGEQALEALKHDRPSLILADARMAKASGWEFVRRIRDGDAQLPILLIGNGPRRPSGASAALQIQAILPDDVSPTALLQEVDRWLQAPAPSRRTQRWPGTILLVDDEPKLLDLLRQFLESHGFRVVAQAGSGQEAIEQLKRHAPTVVLLDVKMPGMDGLATLRQLKAIQPAVTVIMVTAVEEEDAMEEALALGADDYILKPVNTDYLETLLLSKILLGRTP